jgi:hypothetical protein
MLPACDSFYFSHSGVEYPCVLVHWFSHVGDLPDDHTGMWAMMWVVQPDDDGSPPPLSTLMSCLLVRHLFLRVHCF